MKHSFCVNSALATCQNRAGVTSSVLQTQRLKPEHRFLGARVSQPRHTALPRRTVESQRHGRSAASAPSRGQYTQRLWVHSTSYCLREHTRGGGEAVMLLRRDRGQRCTQPSTSHSVARDVRRGLFAVTNQDLKVALLRLECSLDLSRVA